MLFHFQYQMSGWLATFAWQQDCNLQIHGYVDTLAGTGKVCQICMSVCAHRTELWMNSFVWNGNPIWDSPPFPCSYCKLHKLPKIASHVPLKVFGFWPGSVLQFANLQVARTLPLLHPPSLFPGYLPLVNLINFCIFCLLTLGRESEMSENF